jgi:hypothetical protein
VTLRPGTRVRTSAADPDHHTRLPRYLRGQIGEIVYVGREWPLPDDVARGVAAPRAETVYTVRFAAAGLWGTGRHTVLADLWESYLEQAGNEGDRGAGSEDASGAGSEDASGAGSEDASGAGSEDASGAGSEDASGAGRPQEER